eukprot:scaffold13072_cov43-Phaeocystis_antarctica.AAC.1
MGQLYYAQTQLSSIVLGVLLANSLPAPKPADLHAWVAWVYARQVYSSTPVAEPALVQQDIASRGAAVFLRARGAAPQQEHLQRRADWDVRQESAGMSAGIFTGIGPTALGAAGRPSSSEGETQATRSRVGCTLRAAPARSANYLLAAVEPRPQPQSRLTSRWCHGLGSCRPDTRTL